MVGGRPCLALRTPEDNNSSCRGPQDPRDTGDPDFQSGETTSIPGAVFYAPEAGAAYTAFAPPVEKGCLCHHGTASEEPVSVTDEKPTLISVGLMGQVALSRPYPPSSHDEVTERPGWQPHGLPDLPNFR